MADLQQGPEIVRVWRDRDPDRDLGLVFPLDRSDPCPRPIVRESSLGRLQKIPCDDWGCPVCARRKRAEIVARIMMGCRVEKATFWRDLWEVGLSMPSAIDELHGMDRRAIYDREQECFRLLFKRLTMRLRRLGDDRPFYYFRSREAQPRRGSIAPHFLCAGNPFKGLRRRERARILQECGFGYRHSSSPAQSLQGLAVYYTDYITKQAQERDPRYRIPRNVCRYSYSPGFMPDRESFRIYSRLCYQCPEEGVEVVCVNGPDGPVRLDQSTRWWLTLEWRAAKKARWWEHGDGLLEPERVEETWSYVGRFGPSPELRFAACQPPRRRAAAPGGGDRLLESGPAIPTS